DVRSKRDYEVVQFVDVGALAGAETQMVQTDAILLECRAGVFGRRRADPDRGASADAVIRRVGVDDRLHAEEWQQLAIEFARAFEIRRGEKDMRNAVDLHKPSLRGPNNIGKNILENKRRHPAAI